jgi:hypothetical protein
MQPKSDNFARAKSKEGGITLRGATGDIVLEGQYGQTVELKHGSEKDPIRAYINLLLLLKKVATYLRI